jgi:hypothetical protein
MTGRTELLTAMNPQRQVSVTLAAIETRLRTASPSNLVACRPRIQILLVQSGQAHRTPPPANWDLSYPHRSPAREGGILANTPRADHSTRVTGCRKGRTLRRPWRTIIAVPHVHVVRLLFHGRIRTAQTVGTPQMAVARHRHRGDSTNGEA